MANFLGQSNLLAGEAAGQSGGDVLVEAYGTRFAVPAERSPHRARSGLSGRTPGEAAPVRRTPTVVPAGHQSVPGVVTDSSYVGVSTQYLVRTGVGHRAVGVRAQQRHRDADRRSARDVVAHWHPRHAFLLHREPGEGDRTTPVLDTPDAVGVGP